MTGDDLIPSESSGAVAIDDDGQKRQWLDAGGKPHREDGPAVIWFDNTSIWYRHGQIHREDGAAYEAPNNVRYWYLEDKELGYAQFKVRLGELQQERREQAEQKEQARQAGMTAAAEVFQRGLPADITVRRPLRLKP